MSDSWRWCGYAHHFVGGVDCRFSLATFVGGGRWLVSTVGDYCPHGAPVALAGGGAMYETMVFPTDPLTLNDGEPEVISWSEEWCERYAGPVAAIDGHMRACHEFEVRRV